MAMKFYDRKFSFEILRTNTAGQDFTDAAESVLSRSTSDPNISLENGNLSPHNRKKKRKKHKKRKSGGMAAKVIPDDEIGEVFCDNRLSYSAGIMMSVVEESVSQSSMSGFGELRQRNVNGSGEEVAVTAFSRVEDEGSVVEQREITWFNYDCTRVCEYRATRR